MKKKIENFSKQIRNKGELPSNPKLEITQMSFSEFMIKQTVAHDTTYYYSATGTNYGY